MDFFYRQDDDTIRFLILHVDGQVLYRGEGRLGQPAEWVGAPPADGVAIETVLEALRDRAQRDGFSRPEDGAVHTLMVQYPFEDLHRRHAAERALNNALVGHGYGSVDGGDLGMGKMTIWSYVIQPARAARLCISALREAELLEGAVIVSTHADNNDGRYDAHWPPGWVGPFSVL